MSTLVESAGSDGIPSPSLTAGQTRSTSTKKNISVASAKSSNQEKEWAEELVFSAITV